MAYMNTKKRNVGFPVIPFVISVVTLLSSYSLGALGEVCGKPNTCKRTYP